jgi:glycine cleavage system transcriptional repressor
MRQIMVTIVGRDRPGIICQVSRTLADYGVNVVEVSQTTLLGEFVGLFSCRLPKAADSRRLAEALGEALAGSGLAHWVTAAAPAAGPAVDAEPYVVTVRGRDQSGLIPEFSGCMAGFDVNIENLRAVTLGGAETDGRQVVLFFELSVPRAVNQAAFRQALGLVAEELRVESSLQHRDIFEAMHRL